MNTPSRSPSGPACPGAPVKPLLKPVKRGPPPTVRKLKLPATKMARIKSSSLAQDKQSQDEGEQDERALERVNNMFAKFAKSFKEKVDDCMDKEEDFQISDFQVPPLFVKLANQMTSFGHIWAEQVADEYGNDGRLSVAECLGCADDNERPIVNFLAVLVGHCNDC